MNLLLSLVVPDDLENHFTALRKGTEVFHNLKKVQKEKCYNTAVGDEGGFAPSLKSNEEALEVIMAAIERAGFKPGDDIWLALDLASSEMWSDGNYKLFKSDGSLKSADEMIEWYKTLTRNYPIISIEDGVAENDWVRMEKTDRRYRQAGSVGGR